MDGQLTQGLIYSPEAYGPVAELDQNNDLVARFVYGRESNVPDYMVKGSNTYRLIADQLGSVVMVVDATTGAIAQEIQYGPFGEVLADSNPGFQPFGFAGGIYDQDTGLVHFGAREYDAELGRWSASDPIGFGGGDSNLYGYVLGDPVNLVDPSGLFLDTVVDVGLVVYDVGKGVYDASRGREWRDDALAAAADTAAVFVPFGTGAGPATRTAVKSGQRSRAARVGQKAKDAQDCPVPGSRTADDLDDLPPSTIPPGWPSQPTRSRGGTRWWVPGHPDKTIRTMPGNPKDRNPIKRGPYMRQNLDGRGEGPHIPMDGWLP